MIERQGSRAARAAQRIGEETNRYSSNAAATFTRKARINARERYRSGKSALI